MSVYRRPQISRQVLEGAIDAVEVGEGEAIRHSVVFSGMSVRGVGFTAMSRRSHSVSPVSRKEPCRINCSMSASGTFGRRTPNRGDVVEDPLWDWIADGGNPGCHGQVATQPRRCFPRAAKVGYGARLCENPDAEPDQEISGMI